MLEASSPGAKSVKLNPSNGVGHPLAPIQAETPKVPTEPSTPPAKPADTPPAQPAPTPTPTPPAPTPEIPAALAKQQKALWDAEQRAKAADARAARLAADLKAQLDRLESAKKKNPLEAIREVFGWSYDELTQAQLAGGERPPSIEVKEVKGEIEKLRQQREADMKKWQEEQRKTKQSIEARAKAEVDAEIDSWANGVNEFVKSKADEYKLISRAAKSGLIDEYAVPRLIDQTYWATCKYDESGNVVTPGKVLNEKEAADAVEKYLRESVKSSFDDFDAAELQEYLKAKSKTPPVETRSRASNAESNKTVHNGLTASTPSASEEKLDLSPQGRIKAALAAAERYEASLK